MTNFLIHIFITSPSPSLNLRFLSIGLYCAFYQKKTSLGFSSINGTFSYMPQFILNSPPKPHAFVCLPLQSALFNFSKKLYNKYVMLKALWNNKYFIIKYLWSNKYKIARKLWESKWIILASVFISVSLKFFVSCCGIQLHLPKYVILQWSGIVYVIIRLTIKCWTVNYTLTLKDSLLWLLIGTVTAILCYISITFLAFFLIFSLSSSSTLLNELLLKILSEDTFINRMAPKKSDKALVPSNQGNKALVPSNPQPSNARPASPLGPWHQQAPRIARVLQPNNSGLEASNPLSSQSTGPVSSASVIGHGGMGSYELDPTSHRWQKEGKSIGPGPVSSASVIGQGRMGNYEQDPTSHSWQKESKSADTQDLSTVLTGYHTCATNLSKDEIIALCPGHLTGEFKGYGYFGATPANSAFFTQLLTADDPQAVRDFVNGVNIPPRKGEVMVPFRTIFWNDLWRKYLGQDINKTSGEWPIWHRDGNIQKPSVSSSDTLVSLKTFQGGSREELKQACIYVMYTLKECLDDLDNKPVEGNMEFWKFFHEYLATRHFYQVFLLDDNTEFVAPEENNESDPDNDVKSGDNIT